MPIVTMRPIERPSLETRNIWPVFEPYAGQGCLSGEINLACICGRLLLNAVDAAAFRVLAFKCAGDAGCETYLEIP